MSLQQSVNQVKNPIGSGAFRNAYYSKRYDVVIKKTAGGTSGTSYNKAEWDMFNKFTNKEKQFFPVLDLMFDKEGDACLIMKKVDCSKWQQIREIMVDICHTDLGYYSLKHLKIFARAIKEQFNIEVNVYQLFKLIKKYSLIDLHFKNIGFYQGRLVIVDFVI